MTNKNMNKFKIDEINSDGEFLYIDIPSQNRTIVIKIDNQETVLDVYPMSEIVNKPIKTVNIK